MRKKQDGNDAKYSCMTNHCNFICQFVLLVWDTDKRIYRFLGVDLRCGDRPHNEGNIPRRCTA